MAGYAVAETFFQFVGNRQEYRLLVQREGEEGTPFNYMSFLTTSNQSAVDMLSEKYPQRRSIEDFFNFDGAMGFDRASTFNLNIRYGKMSLAMIARAATYQFRQKLPEKLISEGIEPKIPWLYNYKL